MIQAAHYKNWLQESRYMNRGSAYVFVLRLNIMAEVGDFPP
ncbi:MAG: hypothetical protein ACR9NN_05610 [Nostochopsis sp.]